MHRQRRGTRGIQGSDNTVWEDQGGYMNAKIRKLESQFAEQSQKTSIFSGVRVYVNGYTGNSNIVSLPIIT